MSQKDSASAKPSVNEAAITDYRTGETSKDPAMFFKALGISEDASASPTADLIVRTKNLPPVVDAGKGLAGALLSDEELSQNIKDGVRDLKQIIERTNKGENMNLIHAGKGVPHLTFGVRGDLPESLRRTITDAVLKSNQDKDAQEFLRFSNFPGFEPAKLADYDDLAKTLGIK